ncbi:MAG: Thymidylate kinase [uncultured bacterium]|nr:MAG: Thymidylate kinase [uncultured bacterium]
MTRGKFITIEGTEGAGKSTALQFIEDYLLNSKINVVVTREPGGTEIAEEIRKVLLYPAGSETMLPQTELLLMFACRAQHLSQCIQPALRKGKWVVSDRYIDASYAYQGGGRGIRLEDIKQLDTMIVGRHYPDLTFVLDISPELGLERAEKRGTQKDRIEQEKIDFFNRVRSQYLMRAKADPERMKVIDASQTITAVHMQIADILKNFIESAT